MIKIDFREKSSGIGELLSSKYGIVVQMDTLPVGDYIIEDEIVVERKTVPDFAQSIIDGRLFRQAQKMNRFFEVAVFLIEGEDLYNCGVDIHPHVMMGAIVSIATRWHIPIIFPRSKEETVLFLWLIATQHNEVKEELSSRPGYRPKTYRKRQVYILQGLPQVGPKTANELLNYFQSVEKVFTATEEELMKVPHLGKKKAHQIRMLLCEERAQYET